MKPGEIKVGDRVTFDTDQIDDFKSHLSTEKAVQGYGKEVLEYIDEIGTVKEVGYAVATANFLGGSSISIPAKYLCVLPVHL